jgi:DNA polymerase III delta subunit
MIVRQFRLLLLTKEIVQDGGNAVTVSRKLKVQGFVSDKLLTQTRTFSLDELVIIYHQLLEIDEKFKTGGMEADLNLDLLIDSVTREDFR